MAASLRGNDLNSWWHNRAAHRRKAMQTASSLRTAKSELTDAAQGASRTPIPVDASHTSEVLLKMAQSAMEELGNATVQLPAIQNELRREEAALGSLKEAVQKAAFNRARDKVENDAREEQKARIAASQRGRNVKRIFAVLIAAAIVFVVIQY